MIQRKLIITSVGAGVMDDVMSYPVIPAKKTFVIKLFGGADINMGDNKSSVWILQYGKNEAWDTIRILALTGCTKDLLMKYPLIGDGTRNVRIIRRNYSGTTKELPCWIEYDEG